MRLQIVLLVVILILALQGWAACYEDQSNKILQFNSRIAFIADDLFEKNSPSVNVPETAESNNQIKQKIDQDLNAILQSHAVDKDRAFEDDCLTQDVGIQQLQKGFSQIVELQTVSGELGQASYGSYFDQSVIIIDVNSNIVNLMGSGEYWIGSSDVDYITECFSLPAAP